MIMDVNGMTVPCWILVPVPSCLAFLRYMIKLKATNYDITQVKFMRCKLTFYFGGDASLDCTWTARLPFCIPAPCWATSHHALRACCRGGRVQWCSPGGIGNVAAADH